MRSPLATPFAAISLLGCASPKAPAPDLSAEEAAVRKVTTDWLAAETRRDMEASLAFLAPDAIIQPAGAPTIEGLEGMRTLYKQFFSLAYTAIVMDAPTVVVARSGNMAYVVGPWRMVTPGAPDGPKRSVSPPSFGASWVASGRPS